MCPASLYVCTVGIDVNWIFSTRRHVCQRLCRIQTDEDSPLRDPNIRYLFSFFFQTAGVDSFAQSLYRLVTSSAKLRQTFHSRSIG